MCVKITIWVSLALVCVALGVYANRQVLIQLMLYRGDDQYITVDYVPNQMYKVIEENESLSLDDQVVYIRVLCNSIPYYDISVNGSGIPHFVMKTGQSEHLYTNMDIEKCIHYVVKSIKKQK